MTSTEIQLAFPKKDEGSQAFQVELAKQAPLPVTPTADYLQSEAATPQTRDKLSCQALLMGDTRAKAIAEAKVVLPKMLANTQIFALFGSDALDGVNRLVDRMLHEQDPVNIPEVRDMMKELNRSMRGVGKKYDPSDPKVLAKYEKSKGRVLHFIHMGKSFLDEFLDDVRSIEGQIDRVSQTLKGKQLDLIRNVAYYDEFYKLNEEEIKELIYKIGVMEMIRDLAAQQASSIVVGDATGGDRQGEEKGRISEFVSLMEVKIAEYKGRLWVAWAMSPQVRTMRSLNVGLAEKINETLCVTIPTMKSTLVIWQTMSRAQQAAQVEQAVEQMSNEWLQRFADAAAITVPMIADVVQTPTLRPETVIAMANSIAAQADGVIQAIENGRQRREQLEAAMMESKKVVDDATARVSEAQVQHVLEVAYAVPLEIATAVPAQN